MKLGNIPIGTVIALYRNSAASTWRWKSNAQERVPGRIPHRLVVGRTEGDAVFCRSNTDIEVPLWKGLEIDHC